MRVKKKPKIKFNSMQHIFEMILFVMAWKSANFTALFHLCVNRPQVLSKEIGDSSV